MVAKHENIGNNMDEYDCILVVVGHSDFRTNEPGYVRLLPEYSVTTILLANPGVSCFAQVDEVKTEVEENFNKTEEEFRDGDGLFGKTPQEILDVFSESLKPGKGEEGHPNTGYVHPTHHEDYCRFVDCPGSISKESHSFFNKTWVFDDDDPKEIGFIMLIEKVPEGGVNFKCIFENKIQSGGFTISKAILLFSLFSETPYKRPLLLDFGCSITRGTPESIARFIEKGIYGGKNSRNSMFGSKKEYLDRIKEGMERNPRNILKVIDSLNKKKRELGDDVVKGVEALRALTPKKTKAGSRRRGTRRR